ncbi:MAG: glycosyltransferase [Anaerolineae bacterium]|jgi:1,2-diacylglycerol 3-beta-galactosyltransferase
MSRKRVLLAFLNTGGGHRSPALAVGEALEELYGEQVDVELADVTAECFPWPLRELDAIYQWMVRLNGWPWRLMYHVTNTPRRVAMLEGSWWLVTGKPIRTFLSEHPADAIVCCHPLLKAPTAKALEMMGDQTPLITLVTDLACGHAAWFHADGEAYLVATKQARKRALACALPPDSVHDTGLPVRRCFVHASELNRAATRSKLGLDPDRAVVLLLSGADGMGPLSPLLRGIVSGEPSPQIVAVTGRNERLRARLASQRWPPSVHIEGFVHNIHEWMRAADLVVTKAGPSTIAEALVVGIPMVIYGAVPGQEPPNVDYATEAGAAIWAPASHRAAQAVRELLSDDCDTLQRMTRRAEDAGRPRAAKRAAQIVWRNA